jgi:type IV pilus assembly protein PilQ
MRSSFSSRALAVIALLGLAALSSSGAVASDAKTISAVEVQEADGQTRILLRGAEDAIYTAFMREDPPRLIIEMPDVAFEGIATPIEINNGLVKSVTLGAFGDPRVAHSMARISIALEAVSEYEVIPDGDLIVVSLRGGSGLEPSPSVSADATDAADEATPAALSADEETASEVRAVPSDAEMATSTVDASADEFASEPAAEVEQAVSEASEMLEPAALAEPVAPVTRIVDVRAEAGGVAVQSDGTMDNFDAFALADPDRIVVDFWGARSGVSQQRIPFDDSVVTGVRVGEHADKVRVVLDLSTAVASHDVQARDNGVYIELGEPLGEVAPASAEEEPEAAADIEVTESEPEAAASAEVAESEPEADWSEPSDAEPMTSPLAAEPMVEPEAIAAPTPEPVEPVEELVTQAAQPEPIGRALEETVAPAGGTTEPGWVTSVHFESLPSMDRVVITTDGERAAQVVEPDDDTLMVLFPGAQVNEDGERRVDTREFGGTVQMFSVFQTPDIPGDEVRVVLKRGAPVGASLRWEGDQLYVELERTEMPASAQPGPVTVPMMPMPVAPAPEEGASPAAAASAARSAGRPQAVPAANDLLGDDPFLEGPADPASIDILEEGGFDEEKQYQGRRISLDFKDADMGNILRLIAEVSDLNVIAGEEVSGKVTIRLVDVPWDQALDVILLTKGLGFVRIGNILRIAPIDTLKAEREARLQERRSREKLEDLVVKLQPVNFAKAKAIAKLTKKLLTGRGSVNVDQRTNTLIIKDIPSVVHEATALVKALDTQTPQVMIEAKIVEASLDFSRALGSVWGLGWNSLGTRGGAGDLRFYDNDSKAIEGKTPLGAPTTFTIVDSFIPGQNDPQNNVVVSNPISAPTGALTMGLLGLDDHLLLELQIQAQESNGKAKVISSPRVVTMDNKEATIKQGVAIAFSSSDGDQVNTQFVDAVLELRVTPHITANKSIVMKIKVSRNAPQLDSLGDAIGIAKNETTTETIVRDGETMVLGGIYVVDNGRTRSRVPFLADIPILGSAFKSFSVTDERRELLIFVTPQVVRTEGNAEL